MLFNSYIFLFLFLPITLIGYQLIGRFNSQLISFGWLVGASLVFYGYWNPAYLPLILFSVAFNFWAGRQLSNKHQPALLAFSVSINLLLLGYFKYFNFFIELTNTALSSQWDFPSIVLPLAISFFTFQQIAYLVDAHRGLCKEYHFLHYCLFVTFFPQLIAGPIVHHNEMLPQFQKLQLFTLRQKHLVIGSTIFIIGLFKKVVIADNFALFATPIFATVDAGGEINFFEAWQGALAYTFQLYFDFSGYSDMAIGLARLFGIRLPMNFNSPYKATCIIDFWRLWHITLSNFLRDYLYFGLGGNQSGKSRRYVNLFITMLLGGLWHGAGVTFVIWGALHGSYLMINHAWRRIWPWSSACNHIIYRGFSKGLTLLAVIVGWVFFRAESTTGAIIMLKSMVNLPNSIAAALGPLAEPLSQLGIHFDGGFLAPTHITGALLFIISFAIVLAAPNTQEIMTRYRPTFAHKKNANSFISWRPTWAWSFVIGGMGAFSLLSMTKISEFLYFQF